MLENKVAILKENADVLYVLLRAKKKMTSCKFFERARPVKKVSSINSPKSDGRK